MIIGFVKSFDPNLNINLFPNYLNSLIGGILGYLVIWLIILFYKKIKNKEGMGLGDAKLLSAIGFWFGWVSIPFIIFLSSVIALIIVTPSLINKSKEMSSQIPFGPYLVIGCVLYLLLFKQILKFIIV
jgi:leader peptidase (prepilin peptidase)/N-methyltransferase